MQDVKDSPRPDLCPSCERFIGPAEECPYCGAASARNPVLRHVRSAALLIAFGGLALLYATAGVRQAQVVQIDGITPLMSFARVCIDGTVARTPSVKRYHGDVSRISLTLTDGTGELRVYAFRDVAAALAARPDMPTQGDRVRVTGGLRMDADSSPRLYLRRAQDLTPVAPGDARREEGDR